MSRIRNRYQNCAETYVRAQHVHDSDDESRGKESTNDRLYGKIVVMAIGVAGMVGFSLARTIRLTAVMIIMFRIPKSSIWISEPHQILQESDRFKTVLPTHTMNLSAIFDNDFFTPEENNSPRQGS